jgi:hypothetical protein
MKNYVLLILIVLPLLVINAASVNKKEAVIRISVPYHDVVYRLQDKYNLSIIDAQDYHIDAYATDNVINLLKQDCYIVTVMNQSDYIKDWDDIRQTYHSYAQVCSTMYALNQQYPLISKLETLGFTVLNRAILIMKVTDNPFIEEAEPEVRIMGPHHGNEKIATEITLSFLRYLIENYAFNSQVAELVNNREIWIAPIFNVDGHIANSRYNNSGADLNRDYGYMWQSGTSGPWSQVETRAVQRHAQLNNISLEYEYHSTASYVNYLWDYHPKDPPDSTYINNISQQYADSTYGSSTTQLIKINGFDWYVARGSAQDAIFGICGGIGTTIETQYPSTQSLVDNICVANRRALLAMITRAGWGISGTVVDSITSVPLSALVQFTNPKRWPVYTDIGLGDFHKMVAPGEYTFQVSVNGYQSKTFTVTVPVDGVVDVDVKLVPDTNSLNYVQKIVWVRRDNSSSSYYNATYTMDGLGILDLNYYSLGPGGTIVLEADPPIRNFTGNDFTVYEAGVTPESYSVSVSNNWQSGVWYTCGTGGSTSSFDLTTASMDSAKYIKIVDAGGGSSSDPYAGYDLDGIAYRRSEMSVIEENIATTPVIKMLKIAPNPAWSLVNIKYQLSDTKDQEMKIFNADGRVVKTIHLIPNVTTVVWDTKDKTGKQVPAGVYFCVLDTPQGHYQEKVIINR